MSIEEKNRKVSDLVHRSLENLAQLIDVDSVIGKPFDRISSDPCFQGNGGVFGRRRRIRGNKSH